MFSNLPNQRQGVILRMEALHLVNFVHNHPGFTDMATCMTPQGLIAYSVALPFIPDRFALLSEIHGVLSLDVAQTTSFENLVAEVVDEVDGLCMGVFNTYGVGMNYTFEKWEGLSTLVLKGYSDGHVPAKEGLRQASSFRTYTGIPNLPGAYTRPL